MRITDQFSTQVTIYYDILIFQGRDIYKHSYGKEAITLKINKDLLINIAGIILTLAGTVVTGIANKKDTDKTLEKLVQESQKSK